MADMNSKRKIQVIDLTEDASDLSGLTQGDVVPQPELPKKLKVPSPKKTPEEEHGPDGKFEILHTGPCKICSAAKVSPKKKMCCRCKKSPVLESAFCKEFCGECIVKITDGWKEGELVDESESD